MSLHPKGMTRWDPRAPLCGNCGHWSESSESGLSPGTGYCTHWEKLRGRDDTCDHFMDRGTYRRMQQRLAEGHEAWRDD